MFRAKDVGFVPTVYTCNQQLKAENMRLREDLDSYKRAAKYVIWFNETVIYGSK